MSWHVSRCRMQVVIAGVVVTKSFFETCLFVVSSLKLMFAQFHHDHLNYDHLYLVPNTWRHAGRGACDASGALLDPRLRLLRMAGSRSAVCAAEIRWIGLCAPATQKHGWSKHGSSRIR